MLTNTPQNVWDKPMVRKNWNLLKVLARSALLRTPERISIFLHMAICKAYTRLNTILGMAANVVRDFPCRSASWCLPSLTFSVYSVRWPPIPRSKIRAALSSWPSSTIHTWYSGSLARTLTTFWMRAALRSSIASSSTSRIKTTRMRLGSTFRTTYSSSPAYGRTLLTRQQNASNQVSYLELCHAKSSAFSSSIEWRKNILTSLTINIENLNHWI